MSLTSESVTKLVKYVAGANRCEGFKFVLDYDHAKLQDHRPEIEWALRQLPTAFLARPGLSFKEAGRLRIGSWTDDLNAMDQLLTMGLALGVIEFSPDRSKWSEMPGGYPLVTIKLGKQHLPVHQRY